MNKLLVIVGPTATGKTDLGIIFGKKFRGELISCDSRQVYSGLDLGTGKLPGKEVLYQKHDGWWMVDDIPIWLYDVISPKENYDVWQYVQDATKVITRITEDGHLPIIVGGTGLYLKALLNGYAEMGIPGDKNLRDELSQYSIEELRNKLGILDSEHLQSLNNAEFCNKRRLIRRIEKIMTQAESADCAVNSGLSAEFNVLKIGLTTERSSLYKRIDLRVLKRVREGMIDEARILHQEGLSFERMRELGLEYRYLADLLEGKFKTEEDFILKLQYKIHQFAKRQLTWFRADNDIAWFDTNSEEFNTKVEEKVLNWYNS